MDWAKRNTLKLRIFLIYIGVLFALALFSVVCIVTPVWIAGNAELGRSILLSIPPVLLLMLIWMLPAWKFIDRPAILMITTIGAIPLHALACLGFVWMVDDYCPNMNVFFVGMMIHWMLFFIPLASMLYNFQRKLERTAEREPAWT